MNSLDAASSSANLSMDNRTEQDDVVTKNPVDWKKLNDEQNKDDNLLANQSKQLEKDKQNSKSRRRKITPSEAPSAASLEKLASLKTSGAQWEITEDEETEG